ncbi:hypothetical protein BDD12DRAFT_92767 [Trichophaea hybrida]|nr:hypothetical protein BDD12DRAFT_92767 [Trichophaea hybrida]
MVSNEPATVEITNSPSRDLSPPAPVAEPETRPTPPPPPHSPTEDTNGFLPAPETTHVDTTILDEDEDMEDAPGEIDEEFLPTVSPAPPSVDQLEPQDFPHLHSDLHDEDAEGELDDELNSTMYPDIPPIPTVVNPEPIAAPFPDVDSHDDIGNDDDLLGGYRAEDLPSPLGTIDISHSLHSTQDLSYRDPMVDLPELTSNRNMPDGMDLENLTNTSVLSDYPDDLDENGDFDMQRHDVEDDEVDDDDVELGENDATPGKKNRKVAVTLKRESNGRFGRAHPDRQTRRRRS